ncbi:MAG: CBS domain-containing protein [Rhizobiales bacterium]|nr:CBS domain-containing protein [Hyphomicrobiales bacterium]
MSVSQILKSKGNAVVSGKSADTLGHIAKQLASHRIGAVLILDDKGGIAGIVSERDIVRAVANHGAAALNKTAGSIMTPKVFTCETGDTENELMTLMTQQRIRHVPVVDQGKLAGMISIGDVVKLRIENIEREADEMKAYIASAG